MLIETLVIVGIVVLGMYYTKNRPFESGDVDDIMEFFVLSVIVGDLLLLTWCAIEYLQRVGLN